jgi:hypothetical protein
MIHLLIQERYPGDSEEQIRKRAKAWEKFYEVRQIPIKKDTSSGETSSKDTSSGETSSKRFRNWKSIDCTLEKHQPCIRRAP